MGQGLMKLMAQTTASQLDPGCFDFLRDLARWEWCASPMDLGPQTSQDQNRARQKCKRKGLVTFEGGYWRATILGREVLKL